MINFVLKYTGTYGLLTVLAVAIVTPTYLFFSNQQEKVSEISPQKQVIAEEGKVSEKTVSIEKTDEAIQNKENKEEIKQEDKMILQEKESLSVDVFRVDELGNIISAGKVSKRQK